MDMLRVLFPPLLNGGNLPRGDDCSINDGRESILHARDLHAQRIVRVNPSVPLSYQIEIEDIACDCEKPGIHVTDTTMQHCMMRVGKDAQHNTARHLVW